MTETGGLRQRKKARTRHLLVDTALQLFSDQGYEQTTISQIAEAAELSPSTFFLHFATKEDVVFAEQGDRLDLAVQTVCQPSENETPVDVLVRAIERVLDSEAELLNIANQAGRLRVELLLSVPALKAQALYRVAEAQRELAGALRNAFPNELSAIDAAAMVGAVSGAVVATAIAAMESGDKESAAHAVRRSLQTAAQAFRP